MNRSLFVIDSRLAGIPSLIQALPADADYVLIDAGGDGLAQLQFALQGRSGLSALHLVTHGAPGSVWLGGTRIDSGTLAGQAGAFAEIGSHLAPGGDVLLYGCDVAQGESGQRFIEQLAALTGADVAASTNSTGAAALGGDWQLEAASGFIDVAVWQPAYEQLLPANRAPVFPPPFAAKVDYPAGSGAIIPVSADINADGKPDLIVTNFYNDTVSVLFNNGDGTFAGKADYAVGRFPEGLCVGDVNGDSKPDVIVANQATNKLSVLLNNGDGTLAAKVDYVAGSVPVGLAGIDVNGDGWLDLIATNSASNTVSVLINNGDGTFAGKVDYATGVAPWLCASADVNGDGKPDVLVPNRIGNTLSVLLNNGDGTFAPKTDYAVGGYPNVAYCADVNGDSQTDVIVTNSGSNTVSVLLNNGNGTFAAKVDYATGPGPFGIVGTDVNGDSQSDLIVANHNSNTVSVLLSTLVTAFTEQTPVAVNSGINLNDPDGDADWNGGKLKVQVTANAQASDSLYLLTANPGGSAIWIDANGNKLMAGATQIGTADAASVTNGSAWTLTFNASATNALVQDTARAILFTNSSDTPSTANRTVTFTATDAGLLSASATQTITVTAVNDAPVNSLPAAQTLSQDTTKVLSVGNGNAISVNDVDVGGSSLQVTLTATHGKLTLNGVAGLTFTAGDGTADATMTFTGTPANINAALNGLSFIPDAGYSGAASIQIVTNDQGNTGSGGAKSDTDTLNLTVNAAANHAPTAANQTLTINEDSARILAAGDFGFADVDVGNTLQNVQITSLPAAGTLTLNGVAVTANQIVTAANLAANQLAFTPAANANGNAYASFGFKVSDGTAWSAAGYVMTLNVMPVNDAPVITSNGGGDTCSLSFPENATLVTIATATDPDAGSTLTWSLTGGADQAEFQINANTGALAFHTAPNFESPCDTNVDNVYVIQITISDGNGGTDTQTFSVTVIDVYEAPPNRAPTITSNVGSANPVVNVAENSTAVTTVMATDLDGDTLTYSLTGGVDQARFQIDTNTGVLVFTSGPDFETPTDVGANNGYEVIVTASDGKGGTDTQTITVTVTDVYEAPPNRAPVVTSNGGGANILVPVAENSAAVTTVVATDPDGDNITYSLTGGADQAKFQINANTGVLTFANAPDFETPTDVGANNGYEVVVTASDSKGGNVSQVFLVAVTDVDEKLPDPTPTDNDGVSDATEDAIPGLPSSGGDRPVAGDGNGDGTPDSQQSGIVSVPFRLTSFPVSQTASAPSAYVTLVADSLNGKIDTTDTSSATLSNVRQLDAPSELPQGISMPMGLVSFDAIVGLGATPGVGVTETFSLYLDANLMCDAYYKKNADGIWVNLASPAYGGKVVTEGGKTRLDFQLTDGGEFDSDKSINGTIADPGAPGFSSNTAPTITGVPTAAQAVTVGTAAALTDFTVADAEQGIDSLRVTLIANNGSLGGVIDSDAGMAGIQLVGTAAAINAAIAAATFTATTAGPASLVVSVSDGVVLTPVTATYNLNATSPAIPKDADHDQFPDALEAANGLKVGIKDNDVFASNQLFVMQLYRDILYREGETAGVQYWQDRINAGMTRPEVAVSFLDSPEFQAGTGSIARLYFGAMSRLPDAEGMGYWMGQQQNGIGIVQIATGFADSPEFMATYGSLSNADFIQSQFQNVLGRSATDQEKSMWSAQLVAGTDRGALLLGLTESVEYKLVSDTKLSVALDYLGLLGRPAEQAGFDWWVNQQDSGMPEVVVIGGFIASPEYHDRFLP